MIKIINLSILLLILIQGGYFPNSYLLVGILYAVLLGTRKQIRVSPQPFLCYMILIMAYAVSGLVHGLRLPEYADVLHVFVYLEWFLLLSSISKKEQEELHDGMFSVGL